MTYAMANKVLYKYKNELNHKTGTFVFFSLSTEARSYLKPIIDVSLKTSKTDNPVIVE